HHQAADLFASPFRAPLCGFGAGRNATTMAGRSAAHHGAVDQSARRLSHRARLDRQRYTRGASRYSVLSTQYSVLSTLVVPAEARRIGVPTARLAVAVVPSLFSPCYAGESLRLARLSIRGRDVDCRGRPEH